MNSSKRLKIFSRIFRWLKKMTFGPTFGAILLSPREGHIGSSLEHSGLIQSSSGFGNLPVSTNTRSFSGFSSKIESVLAYS
jgi:hypothetical protein